jgi:hypothetical protein
MEIMSKAPRKMTKAPRIMLEPLHIMANAPRIMAKAPRIMLEPLPALSIIAKPPRITFEPLRIDKMPFDHLRLLWLSIKENQR